MNRKEEIEPLLKDLYDHLRAAFALGCAERVLGIYDELANPHSDIPKKAIDVGWEVLTTVRSIDDPIIGQLEEELHNVLPDTEAAGTTSVFMAGATAGMAMLATKDITIRSATFAACHAIDAVSNLVDGERDVADEVAWQDKALKYLAKEPSVSKDMFRDMSWVPKVVNGVHESERYMLHILDKRSGDILDSLAVGPTTKDMTIYSEKKVDSLPKDGMFVVADEFDDGLIVLEGIVKNGALEWSAPE